MKSKWTILGFYVCIVSWYATKYMCVRMYHATKFQGIYFKVQISYIIIHTRVMPFFIVL